VVSICTQAQRVPEETILELLLVEVDDTEISRIVIGRDIDIELWCPDDMTDDRLRHLAPTLHDVVYIVYMHQSTFAV